MIQKTTAFLFFLISFSSYSQHHELMNRLYIANQNINNLIPNKITETKSVVLYLMNSKNTKEKINLEDIGLAHFFAKKEYKELLRGCSIIDPCESLYRLPKVEASRRGYDYYQHAMWIVYAVK